MLFTLLLFLVFLWCMWLLLGIVGGTVGMILQCIILACCPSCAKTGRSSTAAGEDDVASKMDWETAALKIEKSCPPASYSMDRAPTLKHLANFLKDLQTGTSSDVEEDMDGCVPT